MDYAKSYFDKSLNDLAYQNIEDFFKKAREESTRIEFKSYSAQYGNFKKNLEGVIRGLCALLNSEGGILIWGAPEGQKAEGKQEDIFQGALSPVNELKEKDGLINTISDTINPLPVGIMVKILDNGSSQYVYIFEVQVSNYRPHQYKHIYYARLDGQTRPAPHYLVEALMRRITYPNIEGYLRITNRSRKEDFYMLGIEIGILNFSGFQNEENILLDVTIAPGSFKKWDIRGNSTKAYLENGRHIRIENLTQTLYYGKPVVYHDKIKICNNEFSSSEKASVKKGELIVTFSFGGKRSPLKYSRYYIDVLKDTPDQNYNELIVSKEENVAMIGLQTREDMLKKYL